MHAYTSKVLLALAAAVVTFALLPATTVAQSDAPPDFEDDELDESGDPFAAANEDKAFERAAEDSVTANQGQAAGGSGAAAKSEDKKTPGPAAAFVLAALGAVALGLRRRA